MKTLTFKAEYRAFHDAKNRCTNPNHPRYPDWGGRGIQMNFTSFEQFISYIGIKPSKEYQLDRKNNDGDYEVGNVRWATRQTQQLNKRVQKTNPFGISGVRQVKSKGLITPTYQAYCKENSKFKQLYSGPNLAAAILARKAWNDKTL